MVSTASRKSSSGTPAWHADFLAFLPAIRRHARLSFRNAAPELRQELVQETIANSLANYARLAERGKQDVAFPSALARYAVAQVRAGRRIGNRLGSRVSQLAKSIRHAATSAGLARRSSTTISSQQFSSPS